MENDTRKRLYRTMQIHHVVDRIFDDGGDVVVIVSRTGGEVRVEITSAPDLAIIVALERSVEMVRRIME